MNVGIVCCYTKNISELGDLTTLNKAEYAKKYHHPFLLEKVDNWNGPVGKRPTFYKIDYLLRLCKKYKDIDWLCWIDHDALFMNHTIPLTKFIDKKYDMIIGEDWNGLNSGVFFIRTNKKAQKFLQNVYEYEPTEEQRQTQPPWLVNSEQCPFSIYRNSLKIKVVHHNLFNSYLIEPDISNMWRWQSHLKLPPLEVYYMPKKFKMGDFILHFLGSTDDNKLTQAKQYLTQVIK